MDKKKLAEILRTKFPNVQSVKQFADTIDPQTPARVECSKSGTLADGSAIETPTEFAVGADVYITDANGNQVPAPDGEHIVDGSIKITVASGKITAVSPVQEDMSEVVQALAQEIEQANTQLSAITRERDELKTKLANIEQSKASLLSEIAKLKQSAATKSVKDQNDPVEKTNAQKHLEERIIIG